MAVQMSVAARNARLDSIETVLGASAKLQFYTGAVPASCATAASGTKLVEYTLASDWAANASAGAKALSGLPLSVAGVAAGTAGYFRFVDNAGTTCHFQGTITATGGGGDLTLDNTSIASGQTVNVTGFTITEGNA